MAKLFTKVRPFHRWKLVPPPPHPAQSRHGTRWSFSEIRLLEEHYPTKGGKYCALLLGRHATAVTAKAGLLHIHGRGGWAWKESELRYLRKYYGKISDAEICRTLKRSRQGVRHKAIRLGLTDPATKFWTDAEDNYLLLHYGKMRVREIAAKLRRSPLGAEQRAAKLGVNNPPVLLNARQKKYILNNFGTKTIAQMARDLSVDVFKIGYFAHQSGLRKRPFKRDWTAEDNRKLRTLYLKMSRKEFAKMLGRTVPAVTVHAQAMGIMRGKTPQPYTKQEDAKIRKLYGTIPNKVLAKILGRTEISLSHRAIRLKAARSMRKR